MPPAERVLPPHQPNCLGCGTDNPGSMGLRMRLVGDRVRGEATLDRRHEGAPGFVHGGAIATVLDDALGSVLMLLRMPAVTARLEVNYRRPAFIDRPFEVEAWHERTDGRKLHLAAELREAGGEVLAEASALFLRVETAHFLQGATDLPDVFKDSDGRPLPW